jgi:hypothetical protein
VNNKRFARLNDGASLLDGRSLTGMLSDEAGMSGNKPRQHDPAAAEGIHIRLSADRQGATITGGENYDDWTILR